MGADRIVSSISKMRNIQESIQPVPTHHTLQSQMTTPRVRLNPLRSQRQKHASILGELKEVRNISPVVSKIQIQPNISGTVNFIKKLQSSIKIY